MEITISARLVLERATHLLGQAATIPEEARIEDLARFARLALAYPYLDPNVGGRLDDAPVRINMEDAKLLRWI